MGYSEYHARDWAANETDEAIREEIRQCDERYYKPYPLNGTETAQNTIIRIQTLKTILEERGANSWDKVMSVYRALPREKQLTLRQEASNRLVERGAEEVGSSDVNHEIFAMIKNGEYNPK